MAAPWEHPCADRTELQSCEVRSWWSSASRSSCEAWAKGTSGDASQSPTLGTRSQKLASAS
eukprot:7717555-Alexandrium_andersonii.AAC.1